MPALLRAFAIPASPGDDLFRRLEMAMRYTVPRPKVLVVGYPSNPTASNAVYGPEYVGLRRRGWGSRSALLGWLRFTPPTTTR